MREQRLLERIRSWEKDPGRRSREDSGRIIDSVLLHLSRILNTKVGNVQIAEDFGMPDFTDLVYNFPEAVRNLERSIRLMIQKYEPRLSAVQVRFVPQEDTKHLTPYYQALLEQPFELPLGFTSESFG